MQKITAGFLTVLAVLICYGCIREFRERKMDDRGNAVYLSRDMLWAGIICGLFFLVICWVVAVLDGSIGIMLCFAAFVILGLGLMLGWKNCCIFYDHNGFTIRNFFGRQRNYSYGQLTGYRFSRGAGSMKLYVGRKTIALDDRDTIAAREFLQEARHGYARCGGGKALPNIWNEKRKQQNKTGKGSFSAHVHNPGEFLAIFIILIVFFVGMGIFCGFMVWEPVNQSECQQMTICFSGWRIKDNRLVLLSDAYEEPFEISGYEKHLHSFEEVTGKCDGRTQFDVWVKHYDPDDSDPYYNIYQMSAGGVTYRTFADSTNAKRGQLPIVLYAFGGLLVLVLAFSWLTYKIGCNPHKYPKWVVYAFFKRDAISF